MKCKVYGFIFVLYHLCFYIRKLCRLFVGMVGYGVECHELPSIHQGPPPQGTGVPQGTQHHSSGEGRWSVCVCEGEECVW